MTWVSINDALPVDGQRILVIKPNGLIYEGTFYEGPDKFVYNPTPTGQSGWYCDIDNFTHWMPSPIMQT